MSAQAVNKSSDYKPNRVYGLPHGVDRDPDQIN